MNDQPPRVFISYSHETDEQMDRVLQLSEQLRRDGIDSRIDLYEQAPAKGWPQWVLQQVRESDFVLVVCTETYRRRFDGQVEGIGKGVAFEGNVVIQMIYDDQARNTKFIPITFSSEDLKFIPLVLRGSSFYNVARPREYETLYRRLTDQPEIIKQPIGKVKVLRAKTEHPAINPSPLGIVRDLAPTTSPQEPSDLGSQSSPTNRKKQHASSEIDESPAIYATFELRHGEPVVKGKSYKIWVAVSNVPDGTQKVSYEILDDTYTDPKFSVSWGKKDFAEWITSYGDVFLTAKGKGKNGTWRTQTTLVEALRMGYGRNPKATIRKAIADIENN